MDQENSWEYKPDKGAARPQENSGGSNNEPSPQHHDHAKTVSWEAPEFIGHEHGTGWYLGLFAATLALAALVYFVIKDTFASVIIVMLGIIVGVFSTQRPNQAKYEISGDGLSINNKTYNYGNYKSFTIINEGQLSSVNLFPIKRFMPPLSAYFEAADEDKITQAMGDHLPYEERQLDSVDRLARRLRL